MSAVFVLNSTSANVILIFVQQFNCWVGGPNTALLKVIHNHNPHNMHRFKTTGQTRQIISESKTQANKEIQGDRQKIKTMTRKTRNSAQKCSVTHTRLGKVRMSTQGLKKQK